MCTEERKPRPHAEIIKAWADGAIIQFKAHDGRWVDVYENRPSFHPGEVYRAKPKLATTAKYRRYAYRATYGGVVVAVQHETHAKHIAALESTGYFIKWIDTEWQSHEIEVK